MDAKWYTGIVVGIGPCAFWGEVGDEEVSVKNVTAFVQHPQTGQLGLQKWMMTESKAIVAEFSVPIDLVIALAPANEDLVKGLTQTWDAPKNGRLLIASNLGDAEKFRRK